MKTKRFISFLLMVTLLITMNITPGFAREMETHTLTTSKTGNGTVTGDGTFTKNVTPTCTDTEHTHGDGNCDIILSCDIPEHDHDEECYNPDPVCEKEEHQHGDGNCNNELTCEDDEHEHNYGCYIMGPYGNLILNCKKYHGHSFGCYTYNYDTKRWEPNCGRYEHVHNSEDCYGCTKEEHTHVSGDTSEVGCYDLDPICNITEHQHGDENCNLAYKCGKEEHTHKFSECPGYWFYGWWIWTCENEEHTHSYGECYDCGLEEHTHGDSCYDWPETTVTATANEGYYVKSMTGTGITEPIPAGAASYTSLPFKMDQDRTVTVVFAIKQFTVTGAPNDSTRGSVTGSATVDYNGSVTLTPTANRGYKFVKWYDENTDNPRTITNIKSSQTYTAIFESLTEYTVTAGVEGSGSVKVEVDGVGEVPSGPYYEGDKVTITATAAAGNHFVQWKENPELLNPYNIASLSNNVTITAIFENNPARYLEATFNQSASIPGPDGTNAWTITNPSEEDIEFTWNIVGGSQSGYETVGAGQTKNLTTVVENNPDTIEISWTDEYGYPDFDDATATMYTSIEADTSNGSIVDGDGRTLGNYPTYYFAGTTVTLTANPASGYRFENGSWEILPNDEDVQVSISGNTATIIISNYSPEPMLYSLMSTSEYDNGYGDPSWIEGIYVEVDFEVIPPVYDNPTTYYPLSVAVEGPGSVTPVSGTFSAGTLVLLSPSADEGAQFVGWFGANGSEVTSTNGILMNGSKSLIARFELISTEEEITDEETPQSGDTTNEEEIVLDQEVPAEGPTLPQTGGIPIELMIGAGFAFITAGVSLKKKDKEEK